MIHFYESWVQVIPVSGALSYQSCTWYTSYNNGETIACYEYDTTCGQTEVPSEHMDPRLGVLYEHPSVGTNSTRVFTPGAGNLFIFIFISKRTDTRQCFMC